MAKGGGVYRVALVLFFISNGPTSAKRFIKFLQEPEDITVLRNQPAELRCNVSGDGNTKVTWIKDDKTLDVDKNSRLTITAHGSLMFSKIRRQKSFQDDGFYQCVASTVVSGQTFTMISRKARLTVARMSRVFRERPSDITVNKGNTAFFRCQLKRSHPDAKITWSKAGRNTVLTLNSRFVVLHSGILEIQGVMESDAGTYVCKATNEKIGKSVRAKAKLTVRPLSTASRAARFLVKPRSATIMQNRDLIIDCIVTGYPMPIVKWYKDFREITLTSTGHYSLVGASNLKVSAVQPADSGHYQCGISAQKAIASVLVVAPPQFIRRPRDVLTMEEEDVEFACEATGVPPIKVSWFYNGRPVGNHDYVTIRNNSLLLREVLNDDEGIYQCFVKNDVSEIQASAQLTVTEYDELTTTPKPTTTTRPTSTAVPPSAALLDTPTSTPTSPLAIVSSAPRNVMAHTLSATSIAVSWQPPSRPQGTIVSYTLATTDLSTDRTNISSTRQMLRVVDQLTPGTFYKFVVYATNDKGRAGTLSEAVTAQTKPAPTPKTRRTGAPRNVKVEAISSMALKITWREPSYIAARIQNYSVTYQDIDRNTPVTTETTFKLEVVLLKLLPFTSYSVRVKALDNNGPGEVSTSVTGRTKSGKPKGPPRNVKLDLTKGLLVAQWDEPSEPNGNIISYSVELRDEKTGIVNTSTTYETNKIFMNPENATTYAIRVAAATSAGRGEYSSWVKKAMPSKAITEDVLPGKPTSLRVQVVGSMVKVSWKPPANSHVVVRGYLLNYGKGVPGNQELRLLNNETSTLLGNLRPNSIYVINVRAVNRKGPGEIVSEKIVTPTAGPPSSQLKNLRAWPIKNRSLELSWDDPLVRPHSGVSYHIWFEKDGRVAEINTSRSWYLVEGLKPGTEYTFFIKSDKMSNNQTVSNDTLEEVPSVPKDVTPLRDPEESRMKIQWNAPDEPNGEITDYKICWKPKLSAKKQWRCKLEHGYRLNSRISGINGSITYILKISATNGAGEGEFSDPVTFMRDLIKTSGKETPTEVTKKEPVADATGLKSEEKTLWIIIAVIAAITLIAIVIISVILCKKRSVGSPVRRKKPAADPYKAAANGTSKKKGSKDNYWIKQNAMELEPRDKNAKGQHSPVAPTIPRSADEMKPLDSPFQSRKEQNSLLMNESDQESLPPIPSGQPSPSSFTVDDPLRGDARYESLPRVAPKPARVNLYSSPFAHDSDDFPAPPPESLADNSEDGPATSSDYGSEEIVAPNPAANQPPVSYLPKANPKGYVSVATDYDYPAKDMRNNDLDSSALQSLLKDLDAIMAKEDRV